MDPRKYSGWQNPLYKNKTRREGKSLVQHKVSFLLTYLSILQDASVSCCHLIWGLCLCTVNRWAEHSRLDPQQRYQCHRCWELSFPGSPRLVRSRRYWRSSVWLQWRWPALGWAVQLDMDLQTDHRIVRLSSLSNSSFELTYTYMQKAQHRNLAGIWWAWYFRRDQTVW